MAEKILFSDAELGEKMVHLIARTKDAQKAVVSHGERREMKARATLAAHADTGASEIEGEHHNLDYYIILSDERGERAALSIEYGRRTVTRTKGGTRKVGQTEGVFALKAATS